tara:strand:- start:4691 stop:4879 length:189 start_codon:yes stop_codon:yes gene_type:complete
MILSKRGELKMLGNEIEVTCDNCEEIALIFASELELDKVFTCDICESNILMVDEGLLELVSA